MRPVTRRHDAKAVSVPQPGGACHVPRTDDVTLLISGVTLNSSRPKAFEQREVVAGARHASLFTPSRWNGVIELQIADTRTFYHDPACAPQRSDEPARISRVLTGTRCQRRVP